MSDSFWVSWLSAHRGSPRQQAGPCLDHGSVCATQGCDAFASRGGTATSARAGAAAFPEAVPTPFKAATNRDGPMGRPSAHRTRNRPPCSRRCRRGDDRAGPSRTGTSSRPSGRTIEIATRIADRLRAGCRGERRNP